MSVEENITSKSTYRRVILTSFVALFIVVIGLLIYTLLDQPQARHLTWLASFGAFSVSMGASARGRRPFRFRVLYALRMLWATLIVLTGVLTFFP
jgi:hypothetical protein